MKNKEPVRENPFKMVKERYWGNKVDEQRLWLLAYVSLCAMVGTLLMCFELFGPSPLWTKIVHLIVFISVLSINLLFMYGHMRLHTALSMVLLASEFSLLSGFVASVLPLESLSITRAMTDLTMMLVLGICAVHAYLRYMSLVVCVLAISTYVTVLQYTANEFLSNYFPFYLFLAITGVALGYVMVRNVNSLSKENQTLHQRSERMEATLDLSSEQLTALMELSGEQAPAPVRQADLFDRLGPKAKLRLFERVSEVIESRRTQMDTLQLVFPELSKTELSICRLVIQDKRLGEICMLLGKTKGNVTCHRSHIRSKLGLSPDDDLRDKLLERLKGYSVN